MNLDEIKDRNKSIAVLKGIDFDSIPITISDTAGLINDLIELDSSHRNNEWLFTIEEAEAQLKSFLNEQFYPDKDIQILKVSARKGLSEISRLKKKLMFG